MTWEYKFKTSETDIDNETRTIVKTKDVTEEKREEFTLEQKENQLESLKEQRMNTEKQIVDLEAEIAEVKTALKIT